MHMVLKEHEYASSHGIARELAQAMTDTPLPAKCFATWNGTIHPDGYVEWGSILDGMEDEARAMGHEHVERGAR